MTTDHFWLTLAVIVGCGGGAICLLIAGGWWLDRWASRPAERGGAHRAVGAPLPGARGADWDAAGSPRYAALADLTPAHVEVIRLPEIDERTEEEVPVEHVGAVEDWSPTQELELVPERPIDHWEAMEAEIAEEVRREMALHLDPIQRDIARLGHAEQHTCEISFEHVRLAVDAERAGAL